jgi:predicted nucleotidyltransferase
VVGSVSISGWRPVVTGAVASGDLRGRPILAFVSPASNLVAGDTNGTWDVFVRDRVAQLTRRVSVGSGGQHLR